MADCSLAHAASLSQSAYLSSDVFVERFRFALRSAHASSHFFAFSPTSCTSRTQFEKPAEHAASNPDRAQDIWRARSRSFCCRRNNSHGRNGAADRINERLLDRRTPIISHGHQDQIYERVVAPSVNVEKLSNSVDDAKDEQTRMKSIAYCLIPSFKLVADRLTASPSVPARQAADRLLVRDPASFCSDQLAI